MRRTAFKKYSSYILWLVLGFISLADAQQPLTLIDNKNEYHLGHYLQVLEDPTGQLNLEDVTSQKYNNLFIRSQEDVLNYGFSESAYWLRFSLKSEIIKRSPWVLELGFANAHYVDFYQFRKNGDLVKTIETGTMRKRETREHFYHHLIFFVQLPDTNVNEIYMRFKSDAAMTIPLRIKSMTRFMENSRTVNSLIGILIGILLIMAGYNLFLYFSLKERSYLYFSLFITSLLYFIISYNGLTSIYLIVDNIWWNTRSVPMSMGAMLIFFILFIQTFLETKKENIFVHRLLQAEQLIALGFIIAVPLMKYSSYIFPLNMYILIVSLTVIIVGLIFWHEGNRSAGFFLLSIVLQIVGALSIIFIRLKIIPSNVFTEDGFMVGSVMMVLLMSLALGDRIKLMRSEMERAGKNLRESDDRYQTLVETTKDFIWEVDEEGKYTFVSDRVKELLGYEKDDLLGKTPFEFMPPEEAKRVKVVFKEMVHTQSPIVSLENKNITKDGQSVVLETNGLPFFDDDGKLLGYRGIDRDITERKQAEQLQNTVYEISKAADEATDMNEFYKAIHRNIAIVMEAKNFYIALYDEKKDLIEFVYFKDEKVKTRPNRKPGSGWTEYVLRNGKSKVVNQKIHQDIAGKGEVQTIGEPSQIWMGVPLTIDNSTIGVMAVQDYKTSDAYGDREMKILEFVSSQVATSIRKKQVAEQLQKLSRSVDQSPGMVMITDLDGNIEYVNAKFEEVTGFTMHEAKGKNPRILKSGKTPKSVHKEMWKAISSGKEWQGELYNKKKNLDLYLQRTRISPFRNEKGEITHFLSISEDITELKEATEALFNSDSNLKALLNATTDVAFLVDKKFNIIALNQAMANASGKTVDEMVGSNAFENLNKELTKSRKEKMNEVFKSGIPVRWEDEGPKGWSDNNTFPVKDMDGKVTNLAIFSLDITEQKRSEMIQQVMVNISTAVSKTQNMSDFYDVIYEELNRLLDGKDFFVGLYEDQSENILFPYSKGREDDGIKSAPVKDTISGYVIRKRKPMLLKEKEIENLEKKKEIGYVGTKCKIWLGAPLEDETDVIGIIVVQNYDDENAYDEADLALLEFIAKQVAISIKRKQSEEQIRLLSRSVEQSPAIVMITDLEGNITFVNSKFEETTGYSSEEAIGRNPRFLQSGKTPDSTYKDLWETITKGKEWRGEFANLKKNGLLFWEHVNITPYFNEKGEITSFVALKEDVTENKRLQDQLIQSQKMEAVGTLAGGIAHDFNNILTVISGYSEMALMKLEDDSTLKEDIITIQKASHKAEDLTRQILAFSRKQIYKPLKISINGVINDFDNMIRRLIGEDIKINSKLAPNLPFITADPGQLEQILINLIVNARDAINFKTEKAAEKRIEIETEVVYLDEVFTKDHIGSKTGLHISLAIIDNGIGMTEKVKENIFEPFFTTKQPDQGTGLGLATVYGIVKQNDGSIFVTSKEDQGTTIKIYWPVIENMEYDVETVNEEVHELAGTENILFVEDDRSIQKFAQKALEEHGYNVYLAENGKEALLHLKKNKLDIDILVTDLVMPEMNGKELSEKIKVLYPHIKVLYVSGYADDHILKKGKLEENINFLQKPYSTNKLIISMRNILDKTA